jgi:hypothetical protein
MFRSHIDKSFPDATRTSLRDAVLGIESKWTVGGSASLSQDNPLALSLKQTGKTVEIDGRSSAWVKQVLKAASPAVFGDGKNTVYNSAVRDASKLTAADFSIEGVPTKPILDHISKELLDDRPCEAELYSLNVYGSNGHFKKHKDTPRGLLTVGTLVVCLPCEFSNGNFVLSHAGSKKSYAWSKTAGSYGSKKIEWCAFFADVDHEVERIWTGHRVTVTYLLKQTSAAVAEAAAAAQKADSEVKASPEDILTEALNTLVDDPTVLAGGGKLGFPAFHLYTNTQVVAPAPPPLTGAKKKKKSKKPTPIDPLEPLPAGAIGCLKGRDAVIARAARRAGLIVRLQPYLVEECCDNTWKLPGLLKESPANLAKRVDNDKVEKWAAKACDAAKGTAVPDLSYDGVPGVCWVWRPPTFNMSGGERPRATHWGYGASGNESKQPAIAALGATNWSATGYFGNEASQTEFYTYAALELDVPAAGQRSQCKHSIVAAAAMGTATKEATKEAVTVVSQAAQGMIQSTQAAAGAEGGGGGASGMGGEEGAMDLGAAPSAKKAKQSMGGSAFANDGAQPNATPKPKATPTPAPKRTPGATPSAAYAKRNREALLGESGVLQRTPKRSKKMYINDRVATADGKCLAEVVGTMVTNTKGNTVKYTKTDVNYDIKQGLLLAVAEAQ